MSTSLTPYQICRYRVHDVSTAIHDIKADHWVAHEEAISPLSVRMWKRYRGYKREASIWLTAITLLKILTAAFNEAPQLAHLKTWNAEDTLTFFRRVTTHCGAPYRTKEFQYYIENHPEPVMAQPTIVTEALDRLCKITDQLERGTKDFSGIEAGVKAMLAPREKEAQHV